MSLVLGAAFGLGLLLAVSPFVWPAAPARSAAPRRAALGRMRDELQLAGLGSVATGVVITVAGVFGVALNMGGEHTEPLVRVIGGLTNVVFRIVGWVMRLAPFGTFGALAAVTATYGAESLAQLGYLIVVFLGTCVVYVIVVLGLIMRACKLSLFGLMRFLKAELLIALATCSSEAVLPQLATSVGVEWVNQIVSGAVAIAFIVFVTAVTTAASRSLFTFAHEGALPKVFTKVHSNYKTPWAGVVFVGILALAFSITATFSSAGRDISSAPSSTVCRNSRWRISPARSSC